MRSRSHNPARLVDNDHCVHLARGANRSGSGGVSGGDLPAGLSHGTAVHEVVAAQLTTNVDGTAKHGPQEALHLLDDGSATCVDMPAPGYPNVDDSGGRRGSNRPFQQVTSHCTTRSRTAATR